MQLPEEHESEVVSQSSSHVPLGHASPGAHSKGSAQAAPSAVAPAPAQMVIVVTPPAIRSPCAA